MKKSLTLFLSFATLFAFASPAFAEGREYLQYNIEIVANGETVRPAVPVRAPEGAMIGFSASSPMDDEEVVFKIAARHGAEGFEIVGEFKAEEGGKVVEELPVSDILKGNDQGRFFFSYKGNSYEVLITPSSWRG